ncbi:MAG: class I SAM-dependent methyltransferase [Gemmatimonadaceae bacterium]
MRKRAITIAERRFAEQRQELSKLGLQARFERIYHTNLWSDPETRSGTGSSLDSTRVLREKLPDALRELDTRVLLDAPCGDFAWMDHVDLSGIEYIGADIVRSIVESNRQDYARGGREFIELDLTSDVLPDADVLLCRDCLVHLSYANIARVVENVCRANIRYILMTAFPGRGENKDVDDGDWRPLDFEAAPFLFPKPLLTIVEECDEEGGSYADKSLCAWAVSELPRGKSSGAFTDQK